MAQVEIVTVVAVATEVLRLKRESVNPKKNMKREMCMRAGTASTTMGMNYVSVSSYRNWQIRAQFTG